MTILTALKDLGPNRRFSVKGFAKISGIPPSTITSILRRLESEGLTHKPNVGNWKITEKGITTLELHSGRGEITRRGSRSEMLSTHNQIFKMKILDKENFHKDRIKKICPSSWRINDKFKNSLIYHLEFEDATISIYSHCVRLYLHEIITHNFEESYIRSFSKAAEYFGKLEKIGIKGDTLELTNAHYARIKTFLAEFLSKVDEKYKIDLGNGKSFWIDRSLDDIEEETNDPMARENLDHNIKELCQGKLSIKELEIAKELLIRLASSQELMHKTMKEVVKQNLALVEAQANVKHCKNKA